MMSVKQDFDFIWWKHGVIYHIYPRSFYDSNNDGIGDLKGIIEKLDYLKVLGVSAIWLSPIYESPLNDYGYDIQDYRSIDKSYGDMEDFKNLLFHAHQKGIRVIMDMVMNHTSHMHKWFIESSESKENDKRDWYIWKDGKKGKAPNNWKSVFGGSGWEWDSKTEQYYFHSFLKEQPDLNWRNKELQHTFYQEIKFWLDMGVDGFRLDVINFIIKDRKFRNNRRFPSNLFFNRKMYNRNRPKSIRIVRALRQILDQYDQRMLVGEIYTPPPGDNKIVNDYLSNGEDALNLAFNFSLIFRYWSSKRYARYIREVESSIPEKAWPCHVLSNHDLLRSYNRFGMGMHKADKAKILAVLLLTLRGTPFIYYGEEIGMQNQKIKRKHISDPLGKKFWPLFSGRDKSRTPMQWTNEENGGFTKGTPWLPLNRD
ncbi:MAG: alpha-glucosidase, partial [Bacteroidetes bacterium]|nr:alpha-glucosidase [Bacteroidota bacterium]